MTLILRYYDCGTLDKSLFYQQNENLVFWHFSLTLFIEVPHQTADVIWQNQYEKVDADYTYYN